MKSMKFRIDEHDIHEMVTKSIRRILKEYKDDDYDYEEDYNEEESMNREGMVTLTEEDYRFAFEECGMPFPDNFEELLEEYVLPEEFDIYLYISSSYDKGDMWTPPYGEEDLEDYDELTDVSQFPKEYQKVIRLAVKHRVSNTPLDEM